MRTQWRIDYGVLTRVHGTNTRWAEQYRRVMRRDAFLCANGHKTSAETSRNCVQKRYHGGFIDTFHESTESSYLNPQDRFTAKALPIHTRETDLSATF